MTVPGAYHHDPTFGPAGRPHAGPRDGCPEPICRAWKARLQAPGAAPDQETDEADIAEA